MRWLAKVTGIGRRIDKRSATGGTERSGFGRDPAMGVEDMIGPTVSVTTTHGLAQIPKYLPWGETPIIMLSRVNPYDAGLGLKIPKGNA